MTDIFIAATGEKFDAQKFMQESNFPQICEPFKIGGRNKRAERVAVENGLRVQILDDENLHIDQCIEYTHQFIQKNKAEISRLKNTAGVESVEIKIGIFWQLNTACIPISFGDSFLRDIVYCGATLDVIVYGVNS